MKVNDRVFIIAEAGVNHNGNARVAREMIKQAAWCGADAVKFQTFKAEDIVVPQAPKAVYQIKNIPKSISQFEMLKKLELDEDSQRELAACAKKNGIMFLSSPFDIKSISFLKRLGLAVFKIPSGEITNLPYLREIGRLKRRIIMSTGMSDMKEINAALGVIIQAGTPKNNITLMHCVSEYPAPFGDINLNAMAVMRDTFKTKVGFSDHTEGIHIAVAAAALGASVIEKHFTLDKKMRGPDHKASLNPQEFKAMVNAIRDVETAMGSGIKKPARSELKNLAVIRKSIVARRDILKGEKFDEDNITAKRDGRGLCPMLWNKVIGKTAKKDFFADEKITL